jgi:hypothetical protein
MGAGVSKSRKVHPIVTQSTRKLQKPVNAAAEQKRIDKIIEKLRDFGERDSRLKGEVNHYIRMAQKFKTVDAVISYIEGAKKTLLKRLDEEDDFNKYALMNQGSQSRIQRRKEMRERIEATNKYFKEQARNTEDDYKEPTQEELDSLDKDVLEELELTSETPSNLTDDEEEWLNKFIKEHPALIKHYKTIAKK